MAQEMTLKTDHKPSIFNKDMLLGGLLGLAATIFVPGSTAVAAIAAGAIAVGGAVIGGVIGKKRLEDENKFGKKVGEPSFWNKDTLIGGLIGFMGAGLAAVATGIIAIGGTVAAGAAAPAAAPVVAGLGLAAVGAAAIGSPILGAYIGGNIGKRRQARELEEAKQQFIVENISRNVGPEIGQAVAYTMEHNKQWGKQVLEEKLMAAQQAPEQVR